MTVFELIRDLSKYDPGQDVVVRLDNGKEVIFDGISVYELSDYTVVIDIKKAAENGD